MMKVANPSQTDNIFLWIFFIVLDHINVLLGSGSSAACSQQVLYLELVKKSDFADIRQIL